MKSTDAIKPIWRIDAPTGDWFLNDNNTRGLAFNPSTGNLIVASRSGGVKPVVINAATGDSVGILSTADVLLSENFEGITATGAAVAGWTFDNAKTWILSGYGYNSDKYAGWSESSAADHSITSPAIKDPGVLNYYIGAYSSATNTRVVVQISSDSTNWTTLDTVKTLGAGGDVGVSFVKKSVNINRTGSYRIRWKSDSYVSGGFYLDDITVTAPISGGTFPYNQVRATEDGQIFTTNLAINGVTRIYRWANEGAHPKLIFSDSLDQRFGDSFGAFGSGNDVTLTLSGNGATKVVAFKWDGSKLAKVGDLPVAAGEARGGFSSRTVNNNTIITGTFTAPRFMNTVTGELGPQIKSFQLDSTTLNSVMLNDQFIVDGHHMMVAGPAFTNGKFYVLDITSPGNAKVAYEFEPLGVNTNGNNTGGVIFDEENLRLYLMYSNNSLQAFNYSDLKIELEPKLPFYLPYGLLAWYPFNGNANDESGNGKDGTVFGASLTTDRNKRPNSAYQFNGGKSDGHHINLGDFIFNDPDEYSISIWIKPEQIDSQNNPGPYIFSQATGGEIQISHFDGKINFQNKLNNNQWARCSSDEKLNEWTQYIFTYSELMASMKLYENGVEICSGNVNSTISLFSGPALFGRQSNVAENYYNGAIDDAGFWNRALTASEVQAIYSGSKAGLSSQISKRVLQFDSVYTKQGFSFSFHITLDSLSVSDSLVGYQFSLPFPKGLRFDSLLTPSGSSVMPNVTGHVHEDTLRVVAYSSDILTGNDPLLEVFFTADSAGTYHLKPVQVKLNTFVVDSIKPGQVQAGRFIKGDVDDSGELDNYDAAVVLHRTVGKNLLKPDPVRWWDSGPWYNWREASADVDGDGKILAMDASYIAQKIVKVINEFPVQTPAKSTVKIEVTSRGLRFSSSDKLQAFSLELPAHQKILYSDPEFLKADVKNAPMALNDEEGLQISLASVREFDGSFLEIPMTVQGTEQITLDIVTYSNSTRHTHQVSVSGLTVSNEDDAEGAGAGIPTEYALAQNHPNPFNPSTAITYSMPKAGHAVLEVFDLSGRAVARLVDGVQTAGHHTVQFDASALSSGLYIYTLRTGEFTATRKMMLVK